MIWTAKSAVPTGDKKSGAMIAQAGEKMNERAAQISV